MRSDAAKLHPGFYAIAGGSLDSAETVRQANAREAFEELGVSIKPEDLKVVHVLHARNETGAEYINFFMEATKWEGEPMVMEPHKCSNVAWFALDKLPENLMPMHKHVFAMIRQGVMYSEWGWE